MGLRSRAQGANGLDSANDVTGGIRLGFADVGQGLRVAEDRQGSPGARPGPQGQRTDIDVRGFLTRGNVRSGTSADSIQAMPGLWEMLGLDGYDLRPGASTEALDAAEAVLCHFQGSSDRSAG